MSTAKRTRRAPEEAKRLILDAAEVQLRDHGPAGLRLQEVAAEAGVSHPTILHHFGSRDGLVSAIVERTVDRVGRDILEALEALEVAGGRDIGPGELLERIYAVLQDNDHAKLMSWLILSGHRIDRVFAETLQRITNTLHEIRPGKADRQDTLFLVMLASLATLGDAVAGDSMYRAVGLDKEGGRQFRIWLATLARRHLTRTKKS